MGDCVDCGTTVENKNAAGHYRDRCISCRNKLADAHIPHVETCDDDGCIVCQSWREEYNAR